MGGNMSVKGIGKASVAKVPQRGGQMIMQQRFQKPQLRMQLNSKAHPSSLVLVSDLPYADTLSEEDLVSIGKQAGHCVAAAVMDSTSAVLEFSSAAVARAAIKYLQSAQLPDGSILTAREFQEEELKIAPQAAPETMVWIGNLPDARAIGEKELMYMGRQNAI